MGKQREKEYGFRLLFRLKQEVRGGQGMRKGKLQQSVLVRSVFKMLGQKREDAAGPAVGRGISALVCAGAGEGSGGRGARGLPGVQQCGRGGGIGKRSAGVADAAGGDGRKGFKGADAGG